MTEYRDLLLSEAERERELRYHFPKDRTRFVLTRALVRTVLSRYSEIQPRQWRFVSSEFGRPEISNPECKLPLVFNLSHTEGLIALAISNDRRIGIDVEETSRRQLIVDLIAGFFSCAETDEIRAVVPKAHQQERLIEHWTLKEAYLKAKGTGLSFPLDKFGFSFTASGAMGAKFWSSEPGEEGAWQFWMLKPSERHVLSVCAKRAMHQAPLKVWRGFSLQLEEYVNCSPYRYFH